MLLQATTRNFRGLLAFIRSNWLSNPKTKDSDLLSFQKSFNIELRKYLDKKVSVYGRLTEESLIQKTTEHVVSLINDGGKRIRPYICFLAYHTEGGHDQATILKVGIGLEIFHAFALIHDDIIDGGKERHGLPTTHEFVHAALVDNEKGSKKRIAESLALLAGDLVFSWANEAIMRSCNKEAQDLYFNMIEETVAGQMLDVAFMSKERVDSKTLLRKNELKTARYSFVNPMLIGAAEAGSHDHDIFYTKLGMILGQAFQIQDDLLDIAGDSEKTGKTNMLDIQDGQHTFITQYVFVYGKEHDSDVLASLFGKPVDDASRKVLSALFESSGSISYAETEIASLFSEARELIETSDMKLSDKEKWLALMRLLDKRKS